MDLRIVLSWDTDLSDIDLWVIEPHFEKVFYSHPLSKYGGKMSKDIRDGYGPEEYLIKKSHTGKYNIKVKYFGNTAPIILAPITLKVNIFTNYGRKK